MLVLGVGAISVMANRRITLDQDGWYVASLRTFTRADGLLLGALAA